MLCRSRQKLAPSRLIHQIKQYYNQRQPLSVSVSIQQLKAEAIRLDLARHKELSYDGLRKNIAGLLDMGCFILMKYPCFSEYKV
jgi:hypothetical protein